MANLWVPRGCTYCGGKLRKLRTNRTLHLEGRGAVPDAGMYFSDNDGKVTDVFGFYKCEVCGKMEIWEIVVNNDGRKE